MLQNFLDAIGRLLLRACTRKWHETLDAYCPVCGGATLIRTVGDGRVYCPQCCGA